MTTREKILADVRKSQPPLVAAPDIALWENRQQAEASTVLETFKTVAGNVGSRVIFVESVDDIKKTSEHSTGYKDPLFCSGVI
jgi:L-lactate dehydrogenase complex protein LldG